MSVKVNMRLIALAADTMRISQMHRARREEEAEDKEHALKLCAAASLVKAYLNSKDGRIQRMPVEEFCMELGASILLDITGCMVPGLGWAEFDAFLNSKGSSLLAFFEQKGVDPQAWHAGLEEKLKPLDALYDRPIEIVRAKGEE